MMGNGSMAGWTSQVPRYQAPAFPPCLATWSRATMPLRPRFLPLTKPPLSVDKILSWATDFRRQHGRFPTRYDGIVPGELTQTWSAVDNALRVGLRGLRAGISLPNLLPQRSAPRLPPLTPRRPAH